MPPVLRRGPSADIYNVTPSDAGGEGEPVGLLLSLTYAEGAFRQFDRLYVGVPGTIELVTKNGNTVTIPESLANGEVNMGGKRVKSTGTTAGDIVAIIDVM